MRSLVTPLKKNRVLARAAVLSLLVVALVIPQLTWADHASDHPYGQFDDPSNSSPGEAYAALVEKYEAGDLVFHTPGRRDDRSFSSAPSARSATLAANPEIAVYQRYAAARLEVAAAASSARWVALGEYYADGGAAFLAANPEIAMHRRYVAQQDCSDLGLQC